MKRLTNALSVLALAAVVSTLVPPSAFAATPFEIATKAHRGELDGIRGYQTLQLHLDSGKVSVEDIIEAAGETPTPELERSVGSFLGNLDNDD